MKNKKIENKLKKRIFCVLYNGVIMQKIYRIIIKVIN